MQAGTGTASPRNFVQGYDAGRQEEQETFPSHSNDLVANWKWISMPMTTDQNTTTHIDRVVPHVLFFTVKCHCRQ